MPPSRHAARTKLPAEPARRRPIPTVVDKIPSGRQQIETHRSALHGVHTRRDALHAVHERLDALHASHERGGDLHASDPSAGNPSPGGRTTPPPAVFACKRTPPPNCLARRPGRLEIQQVPSWFCLATTDRRGWPVSSPFSPNYLSLFEFSIL